MEKSKTESTQSPISKSHTKNSIKHGISLKGTYEGNFPLLVIRKRGPLSLPYIIEIAENTEHFLTLLRRVYSKRAILKIERRTKLQSKTTFWFFYRRCVITGTLSKRVISQNRKNEPNEKLNKCITKSYPSSFTSEAMLYGTTNEKNALKLCFDSFASQHKNAKMITTGLVLYEKYPFIGGSPDIIMSCDCCPKADTDSLYLAIERSTIDECVKPER